MSFGKCPLPLQDEYIQLAHGGGGRLMNDLLARLLPLLPGMPSSAHRHDAATISLPNERIAFTTDSYVVNPRFFPGGDIGTLAVNGTINDLAMSGAMPAFMSCSFILEEGLALSELDCIVRSIANAARTAGVQVVTGDTKVVNRGKGDGVFINTSGIGVIKHRFAIEPASIRPGDSIILSGDLGRHSIAVMGAREGLSFEHDVVSDTAPLHGAVGALLTSGAEIHCLRDLTRGGLASALVELSEACRLDMKIREDRIPVSAGVRGACEVLGLDPMYLANEGRFTAFVPEKDLDIAMKTLGQFGDSGSASLIGHVTDDTRGFVTLASHFGTERIVTMLSGEQLPRIC